MKGKSTLTCLIILFLLVLSMALISASAHEPMPVDGPLNPEFVNYIKNINKVGNPVVADDGSWLGDIPSTVDLSHTKNAKVDLYVDSYPAAYDLRTLNKLTPVKNQGACGSCWTFATFASLESYGKPTNDWNFSEQDLNANHGFDYSECSGGHHYMSTAYLARWDGPLAESDVPYPYGDGFSAGLDSFAAQKHIQQVVFIPPRSDYLDNDTIKYFVTTYGAVYISFYYSSTYMDATDLNYYCYSTTGTNHAVAVVGWDDNYSSSNFKTTPPGNGAFLIKNSWGTGRHDNGYFYLSYYDTSFHPGASFNNAESPALYERIYQYDPLGWVVSTGYGNTTAWAANVFTAQDNRSLKAVSFYTTDVNVNYSIYIYTGVTGADPRNGTLAASQSGSQTFPGYYTEVLDAPVPLSTGEKFSVVIQFINTGYNYPIAKEKVYAGYSSAASANPGESYISSSGTGWYDISQNGENACIKAFASMAAPAKNFPDFNHDGNADILWRYYGTGGYNAVWLRGTVTAGASQLLVNNGLSDYPQAADRDIWPAVEVSTVPAADADMNLSIRQLRELGIRDGFEGIRFPGENEEGTLPDPFAADGNPGLSAARAAAVSDPRSDPEAAELAAAPSTDWHLCGAGDFNNDGHVDLVWRNLSSGANAVWLMNGLTRTGTASLPTAASTDWRMCGTGDFNNDGNLDLVWRNVSSGANAVWFMNGLTRTGVGWFPTTSNLDWALCGTGDFNNDNHPDLVWRNMSNGLNAVWYMDGITRTGVGWLPTAALLDWTLCGACDFNNDGHDDLLWRNTSSGCNAIWYMNGISRTSVKFLTTVTNATWKIENH